MEYDDQPLQFINDNYFQVEDPNDETYLTIADLIFLMMQFPFIMPFISYATILYMHPKICHYFEQYEVYMHRFPYTIQAVANKIFFGSLVLITAAIGVILMISHFNSIVHFISYCDKVLPDEAKYLPYIFAVFSVVTVITSIVVVTGIWLHKLRKIKRFKSEVNRRSVLFGMIISLEIMHILCYFSPFMVLAFLHDPLVTFSTYFMIIMGILSFLITIYLPPFYLHKLGIKARQQGKIIKKPMALFLVIVTLMTVIVSGYAVILLIIFSASVLTIGNFGSSPTLQSMLLSLLIGLISFWILKPLYKKVQREGLFNNEEGQGIINDEREGLINNEEREDLINIDEREGLINNEERENLVNNENAA